MLIWCFNSLSNFFKYHVVYEMVRYFNQHVLLYFYFSQFVHFRELYKLYYISCSILTLLVSQNVVISVKYFHKIEVFFPNANYNNRNRIVRHLNNQISSLIHVMQIAICDNNKNKVQRRVYFYFFLYYLQKSTQ